ncbi:MAG: polysaccharide biosynthesis C-terminal domain-containing protein [Clostridia bacterium]|nr:polysaccharide biosynthesis C-terminal domain-containing protein [Clostridia bacterium]
MNNTDKEVPASGVPDTSNKKYKKLVSNTVILGAGTFGSKLLVFFLMPLYTRYLSTAQYSDADLITQTANLLLPLVSIGICEAVFRFTLDRDYSRKDVFTSGFLVIVAGGSLLLALSPLLSLISYFGNYTWLIDLYVISSCLHSLCAQFVRAEGRSMLFSGQGILGTVFTIVLNILFLVVFGMGVTGYVLSVVIADFLTTLILLLPFKVCRNFSFKSVRKETLASMLKFSIPLIPTTVFWWITNVADRYMVKSMISSEVNGLYAAAYRIPSLMILLSGIFIEAWQFSALTERESPDAVNFFGVVFESFQGVMFMAATVLISLSRLIPLFLFAPEYYETWRYMPILLGATVFSSLVTFMGSVYLVNKKSILSFITALIGAVVNVVLNLVLIPTPLGANGAALATFASYFIVFVIRAINSRGHIPFDLHTVKLTLNTIIIGIQTAFLLFENQYWIYVQIICIAVILTVNAGPILRGVKKLIRR